MTDTTDTNHVEEPDETVEDAAEPAGEETLTPEQLRAELAKVRREAASRRVLTKEQAAQLKELDDWKKSQMTEAERLKAERDDAVSKLKEAETEKLQRKVARAAKLPSHLADRIRGGTEEEMRVDAEALAASLPNAPSGGLFGGQRGSAVGADSPPDAASSFRSLFK